MLQAIQTLTKRQFILYTTLLLIATLASGYAPFDRTTWWLEVTPVLVALIVLLVTRGSFALSTLLYVVIFVHCLVLLLGGAYTYARVPLGFEIAKWLNLNRNPYDKIGHFMQGVTPALLAQEIFIRGAYVTAAKMRAFVCLCISVAFSAFYEMVEWWAALALGQGADEFLGTQGYQWDTQSDMWWALIGAGAAFLLLAPMQRRQIQTDV